MQKTRKILTTAVALAALFALATPGSAHIDPDTRTAYAPYGKVCITVELGGLAALGLSTDVPLDDVEALLRSGVAVDAEGAPLDTAEVDGLVAALRALLPEDAVFTTTTSESAVDQLLEATACQYANGAVTHSHPHVHRDSTVFETEGMDGWWESTDTTGTWVEGNGAEDAGLLTLGGIPFISTNVGGGIARTSAGLPPGCDVLAALPALSATSVSLNEDSALWPYYYVGQFIHDARLATSSLLSIDADFCGWGIGTDTDVTYELAQKERTE